MFGSFSIQMIRRALSDYIHQCLYITRMVVILLYLYLPFSLWICTTNDVSNGFWDLGPFRTSFVIYTFGWTIIIIPAIIFNVASNFSCFRFSLSNFKDTYIACFISTFLLTLPYFPLNRSWIIIVLLFFIPFASIIICAYWVMEKQHNHRLISKICIHKKSVIAKRILKITLQLLYLLCFIGVVGFCSIISMGIILRLTPFVPIDLLSGNFYIFIIFIILLLSFCIFPYTLLQYIIKRRNNQIRAFNADKLLKHFSKLNSLILTRISITAFIVLIYFITCSLNCQGGSIEAFGDISAIIESFRKLSDLNFPAKETQTFIMQITDYSALKDNLLPFAISTLVTISILFKSSRKFAVIYIVFMIISVCNMTYISCQFPDGYNAMTCFINGQIYSTLSSSDTIHTLKQLMCLRYAWPQLLYAFAVANTFISLHFFFNRKNRRKIYIAVYLIVLKTVKRCFINNFIAKLLTLS